VLFRASVLKNIFPPKKD